MINSTLLQRLWAHDHGITLTTTGTLHVWRADGHPPTLRVQGWIRRHRDTLAAELDPHPDICWQCNTAPVDRYDTLGRPWCDPCHKENQ